MQQIEAEVLQPTIATLRQQGIDYRGVLYAGLIVTPSGTPKVLEFNCRFGDPETQAILPLLQTPLHELMLACVEQRLDQMQIEWHNGSAACVVAAAPGYPDAYPKGMPISGIASAQQQALVFQAGTKIEQQLVCDGGRVLAVAAVADSLASALDRVYAAINQIEFDGIYYRRDIGHSALQ
jgi:phosphoribosylamine--glycine ligase